MINGLRARGVHDIIISAWIREIRCAASTIKLDHHTKSTGVWRNRSPFQGDPAAPAIFNACLDFIAGPFHELCQRKRWGVEIAPGVFRGLFCFADNYWLVATSAQMLERMCGTHVERMDGVFDNGWVPHATRRIDLVYHNR